MQFSPEIQAEFVPPAGMHAAEPRLAEAQPAVPAYLRQHYNWAYVHPRAVQVFERQWLAASILLGQYGRLREAALDALAGAPRGRIAGRVLQIACAYGNFTPRLLGRLAPSAGLDVVDVLPLQLANLAAKLKRGMVPLPHGDSAHPRGAVRPPHGDASHPRGAVRLLHGDSSHLSLASASYDKAVLFFLLHEQPVEVRRATLAEALRVLVPGGKLVIVDYHRPVALHPLRWPMRAVLATLEPFALDLWREPLEAWLPAGAAIAARRFLFGGLYQVVLVERPPA